MKIDRRSGSVVWKLGAPPLPGQHAPVRLPNGNIFVFDNGPTRLDQTFPFSSVIEVNPTTNEIVWRYQDANRQSVYSDRISNAQRLPNGNTLINDGMSDRFFEVTPAGEVVWWRRNHRVSSGKWPERGERRRNRAGACGRTDSAEVAAVRLWGNWGRCGLVRLARGVGGREWSCASGGRPGASWST